MKQKIKKEDKEDEGGKKYVQGAREAYKETENTKRKDTKQRRDA